MIELLLLLLTCYGAAGNSCGGREWTEWHCQCYYVSTSPEDWYSARETCLSLDASLVWIDSEEEFQFVNNLNEDGFWTGLSNMDNSTKWSYDNRSQSEILGRLSETENETDLCIEMNQLTESKVKSKSCLTVNNYICKKVPEIYPGIATDLASPEVYPQVTSAVLYWKNWPVFEGCSRHVSLQGYNTSVTIFGPNQTSDFSYQITRLQPSNMYQYTIVPSENTYYTSPITFSTANESVQDSAIEGSCGAGWEEFGDHCYRFGSNKLTWSGARSRCFDDGADLVSIHSQEEQAFVSSLHSSQVWIGLTDIEREGYYKWSDETPFDYIYWHKGEPNNAYREDCVENAKWSYSSKWNDVPCSLKWQYICKKGNRNAVTKITPPSLQIESQRTKIYWKQVSPLRMQITNIRTGEQWIMDMNEMQDGVIVDNLPPQEFQFFHFLPILKHKEEEEKHETRVAFMTPPCSDNSCQPTDEDMESGCPAVFECPPGWISRGCFCYLYRDSAETWSEASASCRHLGSNLLSILTLEEQRFVDEFISEDEVWLGLSDMGYENIFTWSDYSVYGFTYWDESQPDNGGESPGRDLGSGEESIDGSGHGEENAVYFQHGEESPLSSSREMGSGYGEENADYYVDEESPVYSNTERGSGMPFETDDEFMVTKRTSYEEEDCVSKGSVFNNNGKWKDVSCNERRKSVCKKPASLSSVRRPSVFVQDGMVAVKWEGKCKCKTYLRITYSEEETGAEQSIHTKTYENQTYMSDDNFGLDSGTMYNIHIAATSDIASGASIDVLFRTTGENPRQVARTTNRYDQYTERMYTTPWYQVPSSTSRPTTSRPSTLIPAPIPCEVAPPSATGFSLEMSCNDDNRPRTHLSYTSINADGQHIKWQILCDIEDTYGSTMFCTATSSAVIPE